MSETITFNDFTKIRLCIGTILSAKLNSKAIKPAYILEIDFGPYGIKTSSAQLTQNYPQPEQDLVGRQIIAVINFEPKRVAGVKSEVLVLAGVSESHGTVLLQPAQFIPNGSLIA